MPSYTRIAGINAVVYERRPPAGTTPRDTVVVTMHDSSDTLNSPAAAHLAAAGYTTIAANARTAPDPEDHATNWYDVLADVATLVGFARSLDGVQRVVLFGHSSGAPLMAAYQHIATHGIAGGNGLSPIVACPNNLSGVDAADGVILMDPIFGLGTNVLASMDPAIVDESDPSKLDPALDCFRPENGFSSAGAAYSAEFRARFFAAQAARNNRLIQRASERLAAIETGHGAWTDDEPFVVPGATRYPRLWRPDLTLLAHTTRAHTLLRADGSESVEVVHSVRGPSGTQPSTRLLAGGTLNTSVRRFLSTFATRALPDYSVGADCIAGVDWGSSMTNLPATVPSVRVPTLIMAMTAHYWLVSAEMAYDLSGAADKSIAFVEGATHGFTPLRPEYGDTLARTMDHVAHWLDARF